MSFYCSWGFERDTYVLTHAFPTRRSSDLAGVQAAVREIVVNSSKYLNIYDETEATNKISKFEVGSYYNKKIEEITTDLTTQNVIVIGEGNKITKQYPKPKSTILSEDRIFLLTNDKNMKLPDLRGLSKKETEIILTMLNVPFKISGNGYVESQNINPGTLIKDVTVLEINLANKLTTE